ncbi:hypothetical protein Hanom_Chr15g01345661 [Helianthus anomalus]
MNRKLMTLKRNNKNSFKTPNRLRPADPADRFDLSVPKTLVVVSTQYFSQIQLDQTVNTPTFSEDKYL